MRKSLRKQLINICNKFLSSIFLFLLFSMTGFLYSQERGTLHFVNEHWPPWIIEDKNIRGIDVDIIRAIAQKMDLDLKISIVPWQRALYMIEMGEADILSATLWRKERAQYMIYLKPSYWDKSVKLFYINKNSSFYIEDYLDLKGLDIGILRGSAYFERFDNDEKLNKIEMSTTERLPPLLLSGRIDTFIGTEIVTDYLLETLKMGSYFRKSSFRYEEENPFYITVSKKSPYSKRLDEFNNHLKTLIEEGFIDKTIEKYLRNKN